MSELTDHPRGCGYDEQMPDKHWIWWLAEAIWYVHEQLDHGLAPNETTAKLRGLAEYAASDLDVSKRTAKHKDVWHKKRNHEAAIRKRVGEFHLPVRKVKPRVIVDNGVTVRSTSTKKGSPT